MKYEPTQFGQRLCAISKIEGGTVFLLGRGIYVEDAPPEMATDPLSLVLARAKVPVKVIHLDDGQIVYSTECWLIPEESFAASTEYRPVVKDDVRSLRMRAVQLAA